MYQLVFHEMSVDEKYSYTTENVNTCKKEMCNKQLKLTFLIKTMTVLSHKVVGTFH